MTRRLSFGRVAPAAFAATSVFMVACFGRSQEPPAQTTPSPVQEIVGPPSGAMGTAIPLAPLPSAESTEPLVDLELVDAPVRLVLQRLAEIGGLQLVLPPSLSRTISVQYVRVPVSVALKDVLTRSGLRLGTGPAANLPFDTVTVFYHLPANVDSMSADAIVRRFGVSRAMAELIVKSRRP
jgi:hypothetical protein